MAMRIASDRTIKRLPTHAVHRPFSDVATSRTPVRQAVQTGVNCCDEHR